MLDRLAPLGLAPRKLDLFEQDGHLFLAEELLAGVPLRRFVAEQAGEGPGMPWQPALKLARSLTDLVGAVHAAGVVLRDLSPGNVLVAPDGTLALVDPELAAEPGAPAVVAGTARPALRQRHRHCRRAGDVGHHQREPDEGAGAPLGAARVGGGGDDLAQRHRRLRQRRRQPRVDPPPGEPARHLPGEARQLVAGQQVLGRAHAPALLPQTRVCGSISQGCGRRPSLRIQ
jgi:serine/threonine protein kinase